MELVKDRMLLKDEALVPALVIKNMFDEEFFEVEDKELKKQELQAKEQELKDIEAREQQRRVGANWKSIAESQKGKFAAESQKVTASDDAGQSEYGSLLEK